MTTHIRDGIKALLTAGQHELALEGYGLLGHVYKSTREYEKLAAVIEEEKAVCDGMIDKVKAKYSRPNPRYYRIAFHGERFPDLDRTEYIYKMRNECHLQSMQMSIRAQLSNMLDKDDIVLLANQFVDRSALVQNKLYFQVISVEPYYDISKSNISHIDPHFKCSKFISEVAVSVDGKIVQEDLSRQQKKKTIFEIERCFPYLKNRLPVKTKTEIILTPLENAIEVLQGRTHQIREQLESNPIRLNPLQQVLQGSVVPMVHEGPLKICETFLRNSEVHNQILIEQLKVGLRQFITMCGFAVAANNRNIGPEQQKYAQMLEAQYKALKMRINGYISNGNDSMLSPTAAVATAPSPTPMSNGNNDAHNNSNTVNHNAN